MWPPMINDFFGLPPINQPPILKSIFFIQQFLFPIPFISNSFLLFFSSSLLYLRFKLIIENFKNNYSPNDRFLIKIFMKIISLDSSQRVPPMSPCPPLIITTVCPWLINPLSDPWDFKQSNGILLRSNWRKPYPKFYGSEFYGSGCVYLGVVKKTSQKVPTYLPTWWGGEGFINPVLALYIYIAILHIYIYI